MDKDMWRYLGLSTVTFNDVVERIGITILNSLLYYTLSSQLHISQFLLFGEVIVIVISALLPFIAAPALILIYVVTDNFAEILSGSPVSYLPLTNVVDATIMIIFLFIVPIVTQIRMLSMQGFLTSASVLGVLFSPILLTSGLSERGRGVRANIYSSLPALYVPFLYIANSILGGNSPILSLVRGWMLLLGVVLLILASVLFSLNNPASLTGVIPAYLGAWLTTGLSPLSLLIVGSAVIGGLINGVPLLISELRTVSETKSGIMKEKKEAISEVEGKLILVNNIRGGASDLPVELINAVSEAESLLEASLAEVTACKDQRCLVKALEKFRSNVDQVDKLINDAVFNVVIDYNSVVANLRKYGINAEEIPTPPRIRLTEQDVNTIVKIINTIDRSVYLTANTVNNVLDGIEKVIGGKYNRFYLTDYKSLNSVTKVFSDESIRKASEECLSMEADLLRELRMKGFEDKRVDLVRKLNKTMIETFSLDKLRETVNLSNQVKSLLNEYFSALETKKEELAKMGLPEVREYIKVMDDLSFTTSSNLPTCEVVKRVYSLIRVINDVDEMVADVDSVLSLFQLLDGLKDVIAVKLEEEKCVSLYDLGIDPKYVRYITSWLSSRGLPTVAEQDKICKGT